jgi:divalent metal cation (Fe/Co/Zn/Cd) transporter
MSELIQLGASPMQPAFARPFKTSTTVLWLQSVTLAWMLVELGVSVFAAVTARSPAMMAFGSDSLVELLSAVVVLLQWIPKMAISERNARRAAAVLLFVLALVVGLIALGSLALRMMPETSCSGIGITIAALIAMPILAILKRREARLSKNAALAADAVQSATCAYFALITLAGLAVNAIFHIPWFDSLAALVAIPILIKEGRLVWQGQRCGCC